MNGAPDAEALFAELLDLPPGARAAHLDARCGGDTALRDEVAALLEALPHAERMFASAAPSGAPFPRAPRAGDVLGPWRLVSRLATGGMGEVFEGERVDATYRQRAAIKVVRPELASPAMAERFRIERQVLADLDHPGIARLLDGGAGPDGTPWLAMEYVEGDPIDRWCDARALDVDARLGLFIRVCDAVHHAHRHLVVHRDLKPSNILVTPAGDPKLLDFGIAKVLDPANPDGAGTVTMVRALTPGYASPEQVRGRPVTTASDVYALGVVLHELLCGRSPGRGGVAGNGAADSGPSRSSARVRAAADADDARTAEAIAAARGTTPARLERRLRGDLDTIVARALAPEPARRYGGADELAADLQRHRDGLPVSARPDTLGYRTSRFVIRHRVLVAAVTAVIAVLAVSLAFTSAAYRRVRAAHAEAQWRAYTGSLAAAQYALLDGQHADAEASLTAAPEPLRGWEWRHLSARLDRSAWHWHAHDAGITGVAIARDGRRLATGAEDHRVRLWDLASRQVVRAWGPLPAMVTSVALAGDDTVVAGLDDGQVLMLAGSAPPETLGHGDAFAQVAVDRAGRLAAAGYYLGRVELFDLRRRARVAGWAAHDRLTAPAFDPAGTRLVTGGRDGHARVWDVRTHRLQRDIPAHRDRIVGLAVSPDGSRLVTCSFDRTAAAWDMRTGRRLVSFTDHRGSVVSAGFVAGTDRVVTSDAGGRVLVWDVVRGARVAELRGHQGDVASLAVTPDGRWVVGGEWTGEVRVWSTGAEDVRTFSLRDLWPDGVLKVLDLAFDRRGTRLAAVTDPWRAVVVDLGSGRRSWTETPPVRRVSWVDDGALLLGLRDATVACTQGPADSVVRATTRHLPGSVVALQPNGPWVAVTRDSSLVLARGVGNPAGRTLAPACGPFGGCAFSRDGRIAAACADASIRLWRIADGRLLATLPDHDAERALAFSRDGTRLAAAGRTLACWDLATGGPPRLLRSDGHGLAALAFSPDGRRLATGGGDGQVRLFDPASGRELLSLHGHDAVVVAVAFSPDGTRLASGSFDGTIRVWDAPAEARRP